MLFNKKSSPQVTKAVGGAAEDRALAHPQACGAALGGAPLSSGPRPFAPRGREVHLILRDRDGSLVFAQVRARGNAAQGGAASVTGAKQRRPIYASQHFLLRLATLPPCRFDVVAIAGERIEWIRSALDLSEP